LPETLAEHAVARHHVLHGTNGGGDADTAHRARRRQRLLRRCHRLLQGCARGRGRETSKRLRRTLDRVRQRFPKGDHRRRTTGIDVRTLGHLVVSTLRRHPHPAAALRHGDLQHARAAQALLPPRQGGWVRPGNSVADDLIGDTRTFPRRDQLGVLRIEPKYAELISSWERAGVPNEVISNAIARTDPTSLARRQERLRRTGMLEIPMPQRRGWVRMPAERANYEVAQRAY